MKDFSNENVGKEYNKFKNMLFIGLACYLLAIIVIAWGCTKNDEGTNLHELILNNPKEGSVGYIDVIGEAANFAYYPNDSNEFYFVLDKEYIYVVKMSKKNANALKVATEESPRRISGVTKKVPSDIKKLAIKYYNSALENDEDKLENSDFDNWFGTIYIDLEETPLGMKEISILIAVLVAFFGIGFSLAGGLAVRRFKKKIERISPEERQKIDKEMNDKDAFYYKNAHTYLTKHYIINFMSTFEAIKYEDVIWVYKYELRQNGIKSQQSVQVMTRDGKVHPIATLTGLTKKANDVFNEILETVAKNCDKALIGYTKENREKVKTLIVKPEKKKK